MSDIEERIDKLLGLMREHTRDTGGPAVWGDDGVCRRANGHTVGIVVEHTDGTHGAIVWRGDGGGWRACGDEFAAAGDARAAADAALAEEGWL